jgi:DNA polymerase-4
LSRDTAKLRKILHIDADCFYAAIEMRDQPALRDKPIAVGGSASRRGVIATCNYPARSYGVHSAMPTAHALRLCPELVLLPTNMAKYRDVSRAMRAIFERYTSLIEPLSLDEAYLDVSDVREWEGSATRIAAQIREDVRTELGITVSAGVSINKFVAKVASDWRKPDGLTVIPPEAVDNFVAALPVKKIPGVGRVTCEKLERRGFRTCADIRAADRVALTRWFGRFGSSLYERAHGRDDRPVSPERQRKSVSTETTYATDLVGEAACSDALTPLLADLWARMRRAGIAGTAHKPFVKIKFNDFTTTTVERVGTRAVAEDFRALMIEGLRRKSLPVRLLGVGVRLNDEAAVQLPLEIDDEE